MQDLEHIKIIKTIKQNTEYNGYNFKIIMYIIETEFKGKKWAEYWRTYNGYGDVSLVFGVKLEDYEKKHVKFDDEALKWAYDEYIDRELEFDED